MYENFCEWFSGDKIKTFILNDDIVWLSIKHKDFKVTQLEIRLIFNDSEVSEFIIELIELNGKLDSREIFNEIIMTIDQYIDSLNFRIDGIKAFINKAGRV